MTERSQLVFAKVEGSPGGDYIISNFGVYQIKIGTEDVVVTSYYATFLTFIFQIIMSLLQHCIMPQMLTYCLDFI
jgi:hypothetical protein